MDSNFQLNRQKLVDEISKAILADDSGRPIEEITMAVNEDSLRLILDYNDDDRTRYDKYVAGINPYTDKHIC